MRSYIAIERRVGDVRGLLGALRISRSSSASSARSSR